MLNVKGIDYGAFRGYVLSMLLSFEGLLKKRLPSPIGIMFDRLSKSNIHHVGVFATRILGNKYDETLI